MSDEKEFYFKAGYNRCGIISTALDALCHCCGEIKDKVICVDSSEGEYGEGRICLDCAKEILI